VATGRQPSAQLAVVVQKQPPLMNHEDGNGEVTQDFAGRGGRMLRHRGRPVYRALVRVDDALTSWLNSNVWRSRWAERGWCSGAGKVWPTGLA